MPSDLELFFELGCAVTVAFFSLCGCAAAEKLLTLSLSGESGILELSVACQVLIKLNLGGAYEKRKRKK